MTFKPHPYSEIFPGAYGEPFWELVTSIKKLGRIRFPIILYQDKILDGNQRQRACKEAGVKPTYKEFIGNDAEALNLVWDLNFARRQLSSSMIATCIAKYRLYGEHIESGTGAAHVTPSVDKIAKQKGVSSRSVRYAQKVFRDGTDEEKKALESGESKVKPLAEAIRKREKQTEAAVDTDGKQIPSPAMLFWNRQGEVKTILNHMRSVLNEINKLVDGDPLYAYVGLNGMRGDLNNAISRFKAAVMEHVCPYCHGIKIDGCDSCKGSGLVSEFIWKRIPEEMKK